MSQAIAKAARVPFSFQNSAAREERTMLDPASGVS